MQHYKMAVDLGADYILNTCSSVGEIASAARNILETPILKIDEPMAKQAVRNFQKIAVLATLPTTLKPTINLIKSQAQILGKSVTVIDGLAKGAYEAGKAKNMDKFEDTHSRSSCQSCRAGGLYRSRSRFNGQDGGETQGRNRYSGPCQPSALRPRDESDARRVIK